MTDDIDQACPVPVPLGTSSDLSLTSRDPFPEYLLPRTRPDSRLVERPDFKEPTEAIGLVNYVVSRVGSDLGELSAAKIVPDVSSIREPQGRIEVLTDSAPLKVALTVKAAHSDSTVTKRDEGARCADAGSESDLSDRPQVEVCRICGQQVGAVNLVEHSRLCIAADQCDVKYLSLDKRLHRLAKALERMLPDSGSTALEEDPLASLHDMEERWAVAVLERLIEIAYYGEAITLQKENADQQCVSCIQDLQNLREAVAKDMEVGIEVMSLVVLETFGGRIERLLREKQRSLQKCKSLFQPDSDIGRTGDDLTADMRRLPPRNPPSSRAGSKFLPPRGLSKLTLPETHPSPSWALESNRSSSPGAYQFSPDTSPETSRDRSRGFFSPTWSSPRSPTLSGSSGGHPQSPQGSPPSARSPPPPPPSPALSTRSSEDGDGIQVGSGTRGWPNEEPTGTHAQLDRGERHGQQPHGSYVGSRRSLSFSKTVGGPLETPGSVLDQSNQSFELEPGSHSPPKFGVTGSPYSHLKERQASPPHEGGAALKAASNLPELSERPESGSEQPVDGSQPADKQATSSIGTGATGGPQAVQHMSTSPVQGARQRKTTQSSSSAKYDVFISHAGEDKHFASHLHTIFERLRLRPFLDEADLHPGDNADLEIFGAVGGALVGLVLLGETFFTKKWPMDELREIVGQSTLVPVLYKLNYEQAERLLAQNSEAAKVEPAAWSAFLNQVLRTTMCTNPSTRKSETPFLHHIAFCVVRRLVKCTCPQIANGRNQLLADRVLKRTKKACTIIADEFVELSVKQANEVKGWVQDLQILRDNLEYS